MTLFLHLFTGKAVLRFAAAVGALDERRHQLHPGTGIRAATVTRGLVTLCREGCA